MQRRSLLATLVIILALILPLGAAADDPPAPTTRHQFRLDGLPIAGPAEVVTALVVFPPGAQTPPHSHPGLTLSTVLEGEVTVDTQGAKQVYQVGETFIEQPGVVYTVANTGTTQARVQASNVQTKGVAPSVPQPGGPSPAPPGPSVLYLTRADATLPAAPYQVGHSVTDFAPGAQTAAHTHPGQVFVTILEGEITFTTQGATTVYQVGETFVEQGGVVGVARNAGAGRATVLATHLLPKGAPFSTPVAMPGLPATGAGGMARTTSPVALALLAGCALVAAGWLLRRRARRA